ncbi:hypothetical protein P4J23_10930 [Bacillus cereus]|nr:hypothetical protein [Bacillus cereus]
MASNSYQTIEIVLENGQKWQGQAPRYGEVIVQLHEGYMSYVTKIDREKVPLPNMQDIEPSQTKYRIQSK